LCAGEDGDCQKRLPGLAPHSHCCAPIRSEGRLLGLLNIYLKPGYAFDDWEREILAAAADVFSGIIQRKRAEDEARRLNAELEERVRRRTAELERANKELEGFNSSVSHDLRAPLRIIHGFATLLDKKLGPRLEAENREYLDAVRQEALRMGELIEGLQRLSRAGRQALVMEPVSMEETVGAALARLGTEREGRRVRFVIAAPAPCRGDRALLEQVWVNLISNALKFTRKREEAVIEIGSLREGGETVYFIKDNGEGFDMGQAGRLFKVFQRLHSSSEFEGTGVGLSIVASVIERHGGRVWARAEPGRGASFSFTLATAEG
jgi:light-regulated signal transduction histidine kinase (bacteriophytochrome)